LRFSIEIVSGGERLEMRELIEKDILEMSETSAAYWQPHDSIGVDIGSRAVNRVLLHQPTMVYKALRALSSEMVQIEGLVTEFMRFNHVVPNDLKKYLENVKVNLWRMHEKHLGFCGVSA